jgi:hypothetical protein
MNKNIYKQLDYIYFIFLSVSQTLGENRPKDTTTEAHSTLLGGATCWQV